MKSSNHSGNTATSICCVALCDEPTSDLRCPRTGQPLCRSHLRREQRRVQSLGGAALRVLASAPARLSELERQRSRTAADHEELVELFDGLSVRLSYWRERVIDAVVDELDRLGSRIRALSDASDFAQLASRTAEAGDWRLLFQLMDRIGDSVDFLTECESPARQAESDRVAASLTEASVTQTALERDMGGLLVGPPAVLGPLPQGRVWRIAVCDNTGDYWVSPDGQVVRSRLAPSTGGVCRLAPVCVAVAFHADDSPDHLALLGVDGGPAAGAVGRIRPPVKWNSQVYSLRCDSVDQLLFLSQGRAGVFVLDLAGRLRYRLTPAALGLPGRAKLTGLCLSPGRLCVLSYKERRVLTVSRTDWSVLASVDVSACYIAEFFTESLAWSPHGRLLLTDWAGNAVRCIDAESGRLLGRMPAESEKDEATAAAFHSPYDVLADRHGRLYVVDVTEHLVRLLDAKGRRCLRTFGDVGADEDRLSGPVCLDLWEGDVSWDWLLVADGNNRRIRIYRVEKGDEDLKK